MEELDWIRCRRLYLLQILEEKIVADEKTPVSLMSLYRGVLHNQEKACQELLEQGDAVPTSTPQRPSATSKASHLVASCLALFLFFAGYSLRSWTTFGSTSNGSKSRQC